MEEVKEIVYTAANLVFIAAVLFIALLFFGLRTKYANTLSEQKVSQQRIEMLNRYKEYDSMQVTGYDVMSAITAYSSDVPMYVTGAYNYVNSEVVQNRLYSDTTKVSNPNWFKMSVSDTPMLDVEGMQCTYRKESVYYAILTYDSDSPTQLARDMGLDTEMGEPNYTGRSADASNINIASKLQWLAEKYKTARPTGSNGYTVSGILFICIDVQGAPLAQYQQVAIY